MKNKYSSSFSGQSAQMLKRSVHPVKRCSVWLVTLLLLLSGLIPILETSAADVLSLPEVPVADLTVSAKPNMLFMLDDSASMASDYLPEAVANSTIFDWASASNSIQFASCFDSGDVSNGTSGSILENPLPCSIGDPPYMTADFNKMYYDPSVRYTAAKYSTGSDYANQTSTAAATDPYGQQQTTQTGTSATSVNLTTTYPDKVWCAYTTDVDAATDSAIGSNCRKNSAYSYPDAIYGLNNKSDGFSKLVYGAPYHYSITASEYCTNSDFTSCTTTADSTHTFPAKVRYCKYTGTSGTTIDYTQIDFADCQANRVGNYQYPKFLGTVSSGSNGKSAYATITISATPALGQGIASIKLGSSGPNIISSQIGPVTNTSTETAAYEAAAIANAINSYTAPSSEWEFIACVSPSNGLLSAYSCGNAPFAAEFATPTSLPVNAVYVFPSYNHGAPGTTVTSAQPYRILTGTYPTFADLVVAGLPASTATAAKWKVTICPGTTCSSFTSTTQARVEKITIGSTNILGSSFVNNPSNAALSVAANQLAFANAIKTQINVSYSSYNPTVSANTSGGYDIVLTYPSTGYNVLAISVNAAALTTSGGSAGTVASTSSAVFTIPYGTAYASLPVAYSVMKVDGLDMLGSSAPIFRDAGLGTSSDAIAYVGTNASPGVLCSAVLTRNTALGSPYTITCASGKITFTGTTAHPLISNSSTFTTSTLVKSWGTVTIPTGLALPILATSIKVNGVTQALTSTASYAPGISITTDKTAFASAIAAKIGNTYTGTSSSNVVTIKAPSTSTTKPLTSLTTAANYAAVALTVAAPGYTPTVYSAITISGTNVLTASVSFNGSASYTAAQVATALQAKIGNGYSAVASGSVLYIYPSSGTTTPATPTVTAKAAYATTMTFKNWGSGTMSICNLKSGTTTLFSGCTAAASTPAALRNNVLSMLGSTPTTSSWWGRSVTSGTTEQAVIYSPVGTYTSAPTALSWTTSPSVTANAHASATMTIGSSEGSFGATIISSLKIASSSTCTTPTSSSLLSASTSAQNTSTLLAQNIVSNDSSSDAFTITRSGNVLTITENASGTTYGALNGCTLSVSSSTPTGTAPSISTTVFSGGASIPASGGTFSGTTVSPTIASAPAVSLTKAAAGSVTVAATVANPMTSLPSYISAAQSDNGSNASGSLTTTVTPFANSAVGTAAVRSNVGTFTRTNITDTCSGGSTDPCFAQETSSAKYAGRTDCSATTGCTYAEEIANFSNWYAYYRTRMQAMKTSAGLAFSSLGNTYRVGFITIHTESSTYATIADFDSTQKSTFYTKLYGIDPAALYDGESRQTPLRAALSTAGRIFAGKNPLSLSTTDDPLQLSCQQNFVLMTTDGYWLETDETKITQIDGTTRIDNQDGFSSGTQPDRPYYDGDGTDTTSSRRYSCPLGETNSACLAHTCQSSTNDTSSYSSCNTLADVAYYFYNNDLRSSTQSNCTGIAVSGSSYNVCANNVTANASLDDTAEHQHMTTFTIGLGMNGLLTYTDNYRTATTGDYVKLKGGTGIDTIAWPQVRNNDQTGVDDLWHAAVNGHGQYFSASNPTSLAASIAGAISTVGAKDGAGASVGVSSTQPATGNNYAFAGSYNTADWSGNLQMREIDISTGAISVSATWCASDVAATSSVTACTGKLKSQVGASSDTRSIYMFDSAASNKLKSFTWSNLSTTQQAYFNGTALSHYSTLSVNQKANSTGSNLVGYLRGQTGYEMRSTNTADNQVFRERTTPLGDIIGSEPTYVKQPYFNYNDQGYATFKATTRNAAVFVSANDGMLHAFNASDTTSTGGDEKWAYIPSLSLPQMHYVADGNYSANHRYINDGSPYVFDVCTTDCGLVTATWKTILVGAMNKAGRGYYALDVTDPYNPKALWELGSDTESNIGYSFGSVMATKKADGSWVLLLASGYNNVSPGDGRGYLFVIDPMSGSVISSITTGSGSTTSPSGFAYFANWSDYPDIDNTSQYVYGGDLNGDVWRFDINGESVVKLASLTSSSGDAQPVTSKPELGANSGKRMVFIGTGKLLENADKNTSGTQTMYGFIDSYSTEGTLTSLHSSGKLVAQTLSTTDTAGNAYTTSDGTAARKASSNTVDYNSKLGWYIDLPQSGERINVAPQLINGVLVFASNIPVSGFCRAGGESWINLVDYKTGGNTSLISGGDFASVSAGQALTVGIRILRLSGGFAVNVAKSDTGVDKLGDINDAAGNGGLVYGRRSAWRELVQ